jgi:uncharacterized flavoprotein (TIGR03862 family)
LSSATRSRVAVVAVVGGGPAGLMAAEQLALAGHRVEVHDRMRIVGRKFLLAGRGGLNLTHAEPLETFLTRYGAAASFLEPVIVQFSPESVRAWSESLGEPTFVGSTQRVFPESFQATTLLRAWLNRLQELGVTFVRSTFETVSSGSLVTTSVETNERTTHTYDAVVLALGGASWPRLGADGSWVPALQAAGVTVEAFAAANCGVDVAWSPYMLERFTGTPLKNVAVSVGFTPPIRGEIVLTKAGLEGGPIYALGPQLRKGLSSPSPSASARELRIDLRPDVASDTLHARLANFDAKVSLTNRLRKMGLDAVGCALIREFAPAAKSAGELAAAIKGLKVPFVGLAGLDRAISSTGGVALSEVNPHMMLHRMPGVFVAGEMLDWDAPTGGYLLQACFSTGAAAARGVHEWLSMGDGFEAPGPAASPA